MAVIIQGTCRLNGRVLLPDKNKLNGVGMQKLKRRILCTQAFETAAFVFFLLLFLLMNEEVSLIQRKKVGVYPATKARTQTRLNEK